MNCQTDETERVWNACILFVVKRLSSNDTSAGDDKMQEYTMGFTLSQILKANQLRWVVRNDAQLFIPLMMMVLSHFMCWTIMSQVLTEFTLCAGE